jgi:hypothetical protein
MIFVVELRHVISRAPFVMMDMMDMMDIKIAIFINNSFSSFPYMIMS